MKKNVLLLTCLAVALSCHSCNSKGTADATPPDVVPNDTARYDVTAYVSNAARSMVFWKTGVSYSDKPNMSPRTISLHPDERYQEIDGFGAAITGSSAYNLLKMEAAARAKFLKETFDPTDGIGYSYVRVSIGASDFSLSDYSCCDVKGIENFALTGEELNYVIPVLKEILSYNPSLKVMGSPWTCPRWMKVTDKGGSTPHNSWTSGHLNTAYYQDYATYFVRWIEAFEAQGVPIYSVTPQNEPLNGGNSASLLMEWDEQRDFVKLALGPKLQEAGLNTQLYVFDHNYNYDNITSQRQYPLKLYADADAAQYVAGAAYHNYGGSQAELLNIHNQRPDKELVFTEASIGEWNDGRNLSATFVGSIEEGIGLVGKWCRGIMVWNLMLDMDKKPYRPGGCSTCYGTVDISTDYKTITRNCHYYEIGHLSVVVKPGAHRIKVDGYSEDGLLYEAFLNADGSYALVALNKADAEKSFTISDGLHSFAYSLPGKAAASLRWK